MPIANIYSILRASSIGALSFLFFSIAPAQTTAPTIQWAYFYGGSLNDFGNCIRPTSDGGYIVAGSSCSNNDNVTGHHGGDSTDLWIVKIDSLGTMQWEKSLGGTNYTNRTFTGQDQIGIQQTSDGGYIVAGSTLSNDGDVIGNHGEDDAWIVKLDNTGNIQWKRCYGGSGNDAAYSIRQTNDGGYVFTGYTTSTDGDLTGISGTPGSWIVKIDGNGNIQWQQCSILARTHFV